jgi:dihydroflavonol-4-reductase
MQLTCINPGMVLGTAMDRETGRSISVITRILSGKDPVVSETRLPVTDIADVLRAHVAALDRPESIGQRYIVADRFLSIPEMARPLKAAFPQRKVPTRLLLRRLAITPSKTSVLAAGRFLATA